MEKNVESIGDRSIEMHRKAGGKIGISLNVPLSSIDDLSLAYTPGVGAVCEAIHKNPDELRALTVSGNAVAVVTDGSAVLGLGDIGPRAAMPVMEGKCALFKVLVGIDAWPICLDAREPDEIVAAIRAIAPGFAGINIEDISAPRCFEIEERLQDLGIPVMHDDQHGTAIVLLAGLLNAVKATGKDFSSLRVVISGAGAAGRAIVRLLRCINLEPGVCTMVGEVIVCDSKGAIHKGRTDLGSVKKAILAYSNPNDKSGSLREILAGADVFIGVSKAGLLTSDDVRTMAPDPIVFALANPIPEIMPDEALAGGAALVATGRSDFPNQVNNVLAFPGIFRGAIDARAPRITDRMKLVTAKAIADSVPEPTPEHILPSALSLEVAAAVAAAVRQAAIDEKSE
ncbi:MAG: NADP-dependent malic enzyme [Akkermansiaceae bacterium]|nr:NADP-dependent malic enzyme [Akkermansiaceae bacterium]MDP4647156.1 NADP-dependent malic enzyme [Akkermansiaceae bacterium]MDP4780450.1 NADP-dependent malic enzyme [Akkermansiaceae bacterium]MDP4847767.1 NADP-dependent malic enzyme [Akkermansiaceae bacterium]MDP4897307.1 NADP-dependent malic enzyme [Akkermansiaceae bacterium]